MEGSSRHSLAALRSQLDDIVRPGPGQRPEAGRFEALAEQLFSVSDLLDEQIVLRRTLADPGVPALARTSLLDQVLRGQVGRDTLRVLHAVVGSRWSRPADFGRAVEMLGAESLLASAQARGTLDDVEDQLFRFGRIVDGQPELSLALSNPALPAQRKSALLEALLAGRAQPTTVRLIDRAATGPFRQPLDRTLAELAELAAQRRNRLVAVVTVARPLDDDQVARLRSAVGHAFGREVGIEVSIDPAMLGGVVVRVQDEIIDGSIATRLNEIRQRMSR